MPTTPRPSVYLYVTWLAGLLAGETSCAYATWYRGHYKYAKRPGTFDFSAWQIAHTAMAEGRVAALRADGWTVTMEDQNAFRLRGKHATLAGKPDLVAVHGPDVLVSDLKTGERRGKDVAQVLLYLFALPLAHGHLRGCRLSGEVVYSDGAVPVPSEMLTPDVKARITSLIAVASQSIPPPTVPSARECSWCDVADCRDRVLADEAVALTDAF